MLKVKSLILLLNNKMKGQAFKKSLTDFTKMVMLCMTIFPFITACNVKDVEDNSTNATVIDSILSGIPYEEFDEKNLDYEVPTIKPSTLVDLTGYEIGEEKKVIFLGDNLSSEFKLIKKEGNSEKEVYVGSIENGYGDFSEIDEEGNYYIVTDRIGESYRFLISDDIYKDKAKSIVNSFYMARVNDNSNNNLKTSGIDLSGGWNTGLPANYNIGEAEKSTIIGSKTILNLIIAYELQPERINNLYEDIYIDKMTIFDDINYECQWLTKMQDESGGVSEGVFLSTLNDISPEATAYFGTALGTFSLVYKNINSEEANKYLYQAELAYDYLQKLRKENIENVDNELWFMINAALFRTTGKTMYKNELAECYEVSDSQEAFYGSYLMLTTPKIADADICFKLMDGILRNAENISLDSMNNQFFVSGRNVNGNVQQDAEIPDSTILENAEKMVFVNSIITNREYRRVIQNAIHYINGRNVNSEEITPQNIYEASLQLILYSNADVKLIMN